ncbi:MAG TPA: hypothetical protein VKA49_16555, partial [Flavitalea sp.]|nr:hypothetical protein [Flavitalea sp.]
MKNLILSIVVASCFISCSPATQIEKSWMEPGATVTPGPQDKTLIIAMVKDETSRRVIEDELVKRFKTPAVASYNQITPDMMKEGSEEALTAFIRKGGFTHI